MNRVLNADADSLTTNIMFISLLNFQVIKMCKTCYVINYHDKSFGASFNHCNMVDNIFDAQLKGFFIDGFGPPAIFPLHFPGRKVKSFGRGGQSYKPYRLMVQVVFQLFCYLN